MVAEDSVGGGGRGGAEALEGGEAAGEGVDFVGDQRDEYARGSVAAEGGNRVVELGGREVVALEIDAGKTVNLKIEEAAGGHGQVRTPGGGRVLKRASGGR